MCSCYSTDSARRGVGGRGATWSPGAAGILGSVLALESDGQVARCLVQEAHRSMEQLQETVERHRERAQLEQEQRERSEQRQSEVEEASQLQFQPGRITIVAWGTR